MAGASLPLRLLLVPLSLLLPSASAVRIPYSSSLLPSALNPFKTTKGESPLKSPTDILPVYVGAVIPGESLKWNGTCFTETEAYIDLTSAEQREGIEVGAILNIETWSPKSWTCMDLYAFATPYRLTGDFFFFRGHHKFSLTWLDPSERTYVLQKGLSVFLMPKGFLGTLHGLWDVAPLLSNSWLGEAAQLAFLERRMGAEFVARKKPWSTDLALADLSSLQSGDFLATSKVRGPWGAFETIQKWASGSWSGHSALVLREGDDLYVAESGHYNNQSEPIIAVMPFLEWWEAQLKDVSEPHIAILPLRSDLRKIWNNSAAWEFVRSMDGKKFGFHNIIFSWIDTPDQNFPPPVNSQLVAALASMWIRLQPEYAGNLWEEALNKRLGTQDLEFPGILEECGRREMTFGELLAIPEDDTWRYSDGISTSCVAFAVTTWKKAGILGPYSDDIQATEFTIRDAYNLKVFEDDPEKLPSWCNPHENEKLPYCQVLGKWRFDLPGYNSQEPYPHMNEHCPSLPPDYYRPPNC